jgi:hypothetical protein
MYVVIEMFNCVGVISRTPVRTFSAGKKVVAPNGEIKAETETRNMIHILEPGPQMVYGGSEGCRCNSLICPFFSTSGSFLISPCLAVSSRDVLDSISVWPMTRADLLGLLFTYIVVERIQSHFELRDRLGEMCGTMLRSSLVAYLGWRLLKCALPPAAELAPKGGDGVDCVGIHLSPHLHVLQGDECS